jgi:hypothetical protein
MRLQGRAGSMAETLLSLRLLHVACVRPPSVVASSCRVQGGALQGPRLSVAFAASPSCRLPPLRAAATSDQRPASRAVPHFSYSPTSLLAYLHDDFDAFLCCIAPIRGRLSQFEECPTLDKDSVSKKRILGSGTRELNFNP